MTNQIALLLGLTIVALIGADVIMAGGENVLFLSKKFMNLVEWVAFWR